MTVDQYQELQADVLAVQKLALRLHEMGQVKASAQAVKLVVRLQSLKPTVAAPAPKAVKVGAK